MQHGCKKEIRRVAQRTMVQFLMDTKMDTYLFTYKKNVDFSGIRHRIIDIKIFCCLQSESTMCTFQKKKKSHFMNSLSLDCGRKLEYSEETQANMGRRLIPIHADVVLEI
ncbi:peroxisome biogenesis factor 2 isoform X2 [Phyllobates terribilis]|uniref:peroxisome biogenesis factor 2 isoform X2 n=1 Tax=Phyllobates terribilis TaxID=111132 RepID=UPI003CCAA16B